METATSLERLRAKSIADRYRGKGYEVIEEPAPNQLPDFLTGYRPDLILRKGDESIVVEVKSRESLIGYPKLVDLDERLRSQPGWKLSLVLVDTGDDIRAHRESCLLTREDVVSLIEESERLLADGLVEAALLRCWAGADAIVRIILDEEGEDPPGYVASGSALTQIMWEGLIHRDDYMRLRRILPYRNAYAHGFTAPGFDAALVEELIETTKRVLYMELELEPRSAYAD